MKKISKFEDYNQRRDKGNDLLAKYANRVQKTFYGLDAKTYENGALSRKTKEIAGLVGSLVLRCDDCVTFHAVNCRDAGVTSAELTEAIAVAQIIGGTITIPHARRLLEVWDEDLAPEND